MTVDSFIAALLKFYPVSAAAFIAANIAMLFAIQNGHHFEFLAVIIPNMVYIGFWTPMLVLMVVHQLRRAYGTRDD